MALCGAPVSFLSPLEAFPAASLDPSESECDEPSRLEMSSLESKILEASRRYEAEKTVVKSLLLEAEERSGELKRLRKIWFGEAERCRLEAQCEVDVCKSEVSEREYEARRLESLVEKLRYQRDQVCVLEDENIEFQSELREIFDGRDEVSRNHAENTHATQKEVVALRTKLEKVFKENLDENVRNHYRRAFAQLPLVEKEALLQNATLREEETLQGMGICALSRRKILEKQQLKAFHKSIQALTGDRDTQAFKVAKARSRRDAAKQLATRLSTQAQSLTNRRHQLLDDAFLFLRAKAMDFLEEEGDKEAAIRRGLAQLDRRLQETRQKVNDAKTLADTWAHRAQTMKDLELALSKETALSGENTGKQEASFLQSEPSLESSSSRKNEEDESRLGPSKENAKDDYFSLDRAARAETMIVDILESWQLEDANLREELSEFTSIESPKKKKRQTRQSPPFSPLLLESLSAPTIGIDRASTIESLPQLSHDRSLFRSSSSSFAPKKTKKIQDKIAHLPAPRRRPRNIIAPCNLRPTPAAPLSRIARKKGHCRL